MSAIPELFTDNALISIYFLRASLVLGGVFLATNVWKNASAAIKAGIWRTGMLGLFVLPVFCLLLPEWDLVKRPLIHKDVSLNAQVPVNVLPPPHALRIKPGTDSSSKQEEQSSGQTRYLQTQANTFSFAELFYGIWLLGILALSVRWFSDYLTINAILSKGYKVKNKNICLIFDPLVHGKNRKRKILLMASPVVNSPMTIGVFRPIILLPSMAHLWSKEQLMATFMHELAHVDRHDYLTYVCTQVVCIIYWMNPFAWMAKAQMRLEQEKACDDEVVQQGVQSVDYAGHLLSIARRSLTIGNRGSRVPHTLGMAKEPMLKKRMRSILNVQTPRYGLSTVSRALSALLVLGMILPISAMTFEITERDHVYMWYEAEEGDLSGDMSIQVDDGASIFKYVQLVSAEEEKNSAEEDILTIRLNIKDPGEYVIWGRVLAPSRRQNSFFVSVDNGEKIVWDTQGPDKEMTAQVWAWDTVRDRDTSSGQEGGDPVAFYFDAGWHTLQIFGREKETGLDRLLVTNNTVYRPRGKGVASESSHLDYVWIEPENGRIVEPMDKGVDASASEKAFVWTPESSLDGMGSVHLSFFIETEDEYTVWGRVLAPTPSDNSFFIRLNDGEELLWDVYGPDKNKTAKAWWWDRVRDRTMVEKLGSDRLSFKLERGWHTLVLRSREAGTRMDRVLVTNDVHFVPEGWGTSPKELEPVHLWMEAEDADIKPPLSIGRDHEASNGAYIEVTGEHQSTSQPPVDGHASFYVDVPVNGTYLLWGRVLAPSNGDSFWLRIDNQRWIRWNGIQKGQGWHWEEVHDNLHNNRVLSLELQAGVHLIELAYREKATQLDGLLLTNDLNYVPASTLYEHVVQKREVLVSAFRN